MQTTARDFLWFDDEFPDLGPTAAEEIVGEGDVPAGPAALALAAHLTGLRLTPAHLRDSVFVRGSAAGG